MSKPELVVTLWRTYSRGRRDPHTWRSFIDTFVKEPEVVRDKRRVAGFSLAAFTDDLRALSRVEQVFALTLDFDEGDTTLDEASTLLPNTRGVSYTTFSHTPEHPKLRTIYPLSRPVNAREYEMIWLWAQNKIGLGHVLDESARDASRFWFLPSHPPGAPYEQRELEGKTLDVERALSEINTSHRSFPVGGQASSRQSGHPQPEKERVRMAPSADVEDSFFGRAFAAAGMLLRALDNGACGVVCPWEAEHTRGTGDDTSTVVFPPSGAEFGGIFHCSHAHCARRTSFDLLDVLPPAALSTARKELGVGLVRAKIRAGFVQRLAPCRDLAALERFVLRCYPREEAPLVWTVKIGSRAHVEGLAALPIMALRGQRVDLAVRDREITWGRLVPNEVFIPRGAT